MIGNDIVDLKTARDHSDWRRKGFLEKVFTAGEINLIAASEEKDLLVWLLWSMKEATYKAHQRKFALPRRLNWKDQDCISVRISEGAATGVVQVGKETYYTLSELHHEAEVIHSISSDKKDPDHRTFFGSHSSSLSKQALLQDIARTHCLPIGDLALIKDCNEVPQFRLQNKLFPLAFSLSDHGRFSGFCLSLRTS